MFSQVLAIDVCERVPNFNARLKAFTVSEPIIYKSADEIISSPLRQSVDAIVISIHQALTEDVLSRLPQLRYIGILGTSVKRIPLAWCNAHNVTVSNITEYCDDDTAEWVIMKTLNFFRSRHPARSARNKILGVIGVGAVGRSVVALARGLHMRVVYNAKGVHRDLDSDDVVLKSKEEIFLTADVITVHTPGFLSWLDADLLRMARPNLCIINTCMGRISVGNDLESVLHERGDITVIMDKIAGDNYPELTGRAQIHAENAFLTEDAELCLVDKFFENLRRELVK